MIFISYNICGQNIGNSVFFDRNSKKWFQMIAGLEIWAKIEHCFVRPILTNFTLQTNLAKIEPHSSILQEFNFSSVLQVFGIKGKCENCNKHGRALFFAILLWNDHFLSICIVEKNCSSLVSPANGTITYTPSGDTTCGSVARYSCNVGFELSALDKLRFCREDKMWNGTENNCSGKLVMHQSLSSFSHLLLMV